MDKLLLNYLDRYYSLLDENRASLVYAIPEYSSWWNHRVFSDDELKAFILELIAELLNKGIKVTHRKRSSRINLLTKYGTDVNEIPVKIYNDWLNSGGITQYRSGENYNPVENIYFTRNCDDIPMGQSVRFYFDEYVKLSGKDVYLLDILGGDIKFGLSINDADNLADKVIKHYLLSGRTLRYYNKDRANVKIFGNKPFDIADNIMDTWIKYGRNNCNNPLLNIDGLFFDSFSLSDTQYVELVQSYTNDILEETTKDTLYLTHMLPELPEEEFKHFFIDVSTLIFRNNVKVSHRNNKGKVALMTKYGEDPCKMAQNLYMDWSARGGHYRLFNPIENVCFSKQYSDIKNKQHLSYYFNKYISEFHYGSIFLFEILGGDVRFQISEEDADKLGFLLIEYFLNNEWELEYFNGKKCLLYGNTPTTIANNIIYEWNKLGRNKVNNKFLCIDGLRFNKLETV